MKTTEIQVNAAKNTGVPSSEVKPTDTLNGYLDMSEDAILNRLGLPAPQRICRECGGITFGGVMRGDGVWCIACATKGADQG